MRAGLIVSVTAHLAILAWGLIALISPSALDSQIEALPVDLVKLDDVTDLAKGLTTATVAKKPAPNDPAKKAADKPQPMPPKPAATPAADAPPPPPPPPPPAAAEAAPPKTPPPAAPPPTAVAAKAAEPKPETTPPPPTPVAAAEAPPSKPVPKPHVRPPHTATLPPPPDTTSDFDPDKIASLLSREPPPATGLTSDELATLGVSTGGDTPKMTENELDALRAQVQKCWVLPTGWTDPRQVSVVIRFGLNQDGTVLGAPVVIEGPVGQYGPVSGENAIRAVLRCGPYRLPPEKYDQWKEVQIRFTPET
jgi:hypothetical protein